MTTTDPSNTAQPSSDPDDQQLREHTYDGIQEYDNPMPGWWLWIFYATILFAILYPLGVHVFGLIPTYQEDLVSGQAEIQALRTAYEEANPTFQADSTTFAKYLGVPEHIEAGKALFQTSCSVCHGKSAEGLIGPNLTDNAWIHGNKNTDLFLVITNGVQKKGMAAWGKILSPEERMQLITFIRSIAGTNPAGAKPAQGEVYENV